MQSQKWGRPPQNLRLFYQVRWLEDIFLHPAGPVQIGWMPSFCRITTAVCHKSQSRSRTMSFGSPNITRNSGAFKRSQRPFRGACWHTLALEPQTYAQTLIIGFWLFSCRTNSKPHQFRAYKHFSEPGTHTVRNWLDHRITKRHTLRMQRHMRYTQRTNTATRKHLHTRFSDQSMRDTQSRTSNVTV